MTLVKQAHHKFNPENEQVVQQTINSTVKEIGRHEHNHVFMDNIIKNSEVHVQQSKPLAIPKKPRYTQGMSKVEFEKLEIEAFLNWRKNLALEEEKNLNYAITPFEKNIEVWKQLWLVVDKCEVLIIILDGRNPLYFRCPDLENYIKEVSNDKEIFFIINKSDLLSSDVRKHWAQYFTENKMNYVFFSALEEIIKIENEEDKPITDDIKEEEKKAEKEEEAKKEAEKEAKEAAEQKAAAEALKEKMAKFDEEQKSLDEERSELKKEQKKLDDKIKKGKKLDKLKEAQEKLDEKNKKLDEKQEKLDDKRKKALKKAN